jgi:hypothetical protein
VEGSGATDESTDGEAPLACVPGSGTPLGISMLPGADVVSSGGFLAECVIASIEASSASLQCPSDDGELEVMLTLESFSGDLTAIASLGEPIDLAYYTTLPAEVNPPARHMTWHRPRDSALLLVAADVAAPHGLPDGTEPLTLGVLESTDCDATDGSCGTGVMRRVAVEVTLGDVGTARVFDGNASMLGDYLVQVGTALLDEGHCEGDSENRYTFAIVKTSP